MTAALRYEWVRVTTVRSTWISLALTFVGVLALAFLSSVPAYLEFDAAGEDHCQSGSLADDLTDIYCELKYGLTLLDAQPDDPTEAFDGWRTGYRVHWGQHLVDAERHLYALQSRNRLRGRAS